MSSDIRELIQVDDVMEDHSLRFGPNGGLVFCMEYFANNFDWLEDSLGHVEDDYILFDCPGRRTQTDSKVRRLFVLSQLWRCGLFLQVRSNFTLTSQS